MTTWSEVLPPLVDRENPSDEDIARGIKNWRKRELQDCDWTQLSDVDLINKWDWAVYRQELRDLPAQGADPKLWVFPTRPA
jgi:hypothetical protein